jgi:hypothetical protein
VQQHAGAVEDTGQAERGLAAEPLCRRVDDGIARGVGLARANGRALLVDRGDDVRFDRLGAKNGNEPRNARFVENPVDGRRPAAVRR